MILSLEWCNREVEIVVCSISVYSVDSQADLAEGDILFDLLAHPDGAVADAFGLDIREGYTDCRTFVLADGEVFAMYDPELADLADHATAVLNGIRNGFITGG